MLAYALLLILLAPLTFLSGNLENLFSPDELTAMGIRLETSQAEKTPCNASSCHAALNKKAPPFDGAFDCS